MRPTRDTLKTCRTSTRPATLRVYPARAALPAPCTDRPGYRRSHDRRELDAVALGQLPRTVIRNNVEANYQCVRSAANSTSASEIAPTAACSTRSRARSAGKSASVDLSVSTEPCTSALTMTFSSGISSSLLPARSSSSVLGFCTTRSSFWRRRSRTSSAVALATERLSTT